MSVSGGTIERAVADRLATVVEVAEYLSVSRSKVYMMMDAGELAFVKLGASRRVRWSDVEKLVAENLIGANS